MAIRLNHEAAAAFVPPSASNRKYGQQLVLQQQKFANDQRQGMQDRMYDQQREYRRTAYQLQKDQTDRFVDNQRMQEQQKFAEKMQKTGLDAQEKRAQQEMQMRAREQEMRRLEQLKQQQQMDDFDGIASGEFDEQTSKEIKELWRKKNQIPIDDNLDEAMKSEALGKVEERLNGLRGARVKAPSDEEKLNKNVWWVEPSGNYRRPDMQAFPDGPPEGWSIYDGNRKDGGSGGGARSQKSRQELPQLYEDYADMDNEKSIKELRAKKAELQDRALYGGKKYDTDQELEDAAYAELKGEYERQRGRISRGKQKTAAPAAPPQAGQPAAPPAQAPAAPPPAMGMQDLEPTYNADGTTASPSNPRIPTPGKPVKFVDENGRDVVRKVGDDGSIWQWVGGSEREITLDELGNEGPPPPVVPISSEQEQSLSDQQALLEREKRLATPAQSGQAVKPTLDVRFPKKSPFEDPAAAEAGPHGDWAKKIHADLLKEEDGQSVMHAQVGQPAASPMRAFHQDGRIFEQSPDGNWREVQPVASQPIQQADGSMWQQSPTDGAWRQVPAAVPEQPAREPFAMPPARPLQPGEEDGAATFGPKAPGVQQQPVDTLPMDQTGMQPSQQNVWAEFAAPEQELPQQKKEDATTLAKQPPAVQEDIDFDKLAESADESDRALYGELQNIYSKLVKSPQSPMIQNAISVVVNQQSNPKLAAQAYLYLQSQGIDLSKLSRPKKRQRAGMSGIR